MLKGYQLLNGGKEEADLNKKELLLLVSLGQPSEPSAEEIETIVGRFKVRSKSKEAIPKRPDITLLPAGQLQIFNAWMTEWQHAVKNGFKGITSRDEILEITAKKQCALWNYTQLISRLFADGFFSPTDKEAFSTEIKSLQSYETLDTLFAQLKEKEETWKASVLARHLPIKFAKWSEYCPTPTADMSTEKLLLWIRYFPELYTMIFPISPQEEPETRATGSVKKNTIRKAFFTTALTIMAHNGSREFGLLINEFHQRINTRFPKKDFNFSIDQKSKTNELFLTFNQHLRTIASGGEFEEKKNGVATKLCLELLYDEIEKLKDAEPQFYEAAHLKLLKLMLNQPVAHKVLDIKKLTVNDYINFIHEKISSSEILSVRSKAFLMIELLLLTASQQISEINSTNLQDYITSIFTLTSSSTAEDLHYISLVFFRNWILNQHDSTERQLLNGTINKVTFLEFAKHLDSLLAANEELPLCETLLRLFKLKEKLKPKKLNEEEIRTIVIELEQIDRLLPKNKIEISLTRALSINLHYLLQESTAKIIWAHHFGAIIYNGEESEAFKAITRYYHPELKWVSMMDRSKEHPAHKTAALLFPEPSRAESSITVAPKDSGFLVDQTNRSAVAKVIGLLATLADEDDRAMSTIHYLSAVTLAKHLPRKGELPFIRDAVSEYSHDHLEKSKDTPPPSITPTSPTFMMPHSPAF